MLSIDTRRVTDQVADPAHPAAGSRAMDRALSLSTRPWRVLGVSSHVWWCTAEEEVLVITNDRTAYLPNAVVVPNLSVAGMGGEIIIGGGRIVAGEVEWRIVRWWDPGVAPIPADRAHVAATVRSVSGSRSLGGTFAEALRRRDPGDALAHARAMIGRGPGLTPSSDDHLIGAIAGFRHAARSVGDGDADAVLETIRRPVLDAAQAATTSLSRSLLARAFAVEVAAPVGRVLRAITGRGDIEAALAATAAIGHHSGPAMATGVIEGTAAACGVSP